MKKILILPIIVLALSVSGCANKAIAPANQSTGSEQTNKQVNSVLPTAPTGQAVEPIVSKTASYPTFKNDAAGYKLIYPADWFVDNTSTNGNVIFANYKNASQFNASNAPKDLRKVTISVIDYDASKTLEDYYNSKQWPANFKKIKINKVEALQINKNCVVTDLLKNNGKIYSIDYNDYKCVGRIEDWVAASFNFLP